MKTARRRIDVNLAELDRVLDDARQAPLSEADHGKLKDTLHAMAALLIRSRNTEKTSAVLDKSEAGAGEQAAGKKPPPPGHGRKGADAFAGARVGRKYHCQTLVHLKQTLQDAPQRAAIVHIRGPMQCDQCKALG